MKIEPPLFRRLPDRQIACWTDARVTTLLSGPKDRHGNLQVGLYLTGFHNEIILDGRGLTSSISFSGTLSGSQTQRFAGVAVKINVVASNALHQDGDGRESVGAMFVNDFGFSESVAELALCLWGSPSLDATLKAHVESAKQWGMDGAFLVLYVDMQGLESASSSRVLGVGQVEGFRGFPVRLMCIDQKLTIPRWTQSICTS